MSPPDRRAAVVGTGLIGGSVGLGLRRRGWHVSGVDRDEERAGRALEIGALDALGPDPRAAVTFVATPVGAVVGAARRALELTGGFVTDVGSVKAPIVDGVASPRFIGGHPMAGSEQEGVEGADPHLFEGAVWVLTPTPDSDDEAYTAVAGAVRDLGADVVALPPRDHDALVAVVSHVPHLTAATLMSLADERATEHQALLRLAAGGFRDMTRVAAGHPGIWPDICGENREAIVEVLDGLLDALGRIRDVVAEDDRPALLSSLDRARVARRNLPGRYTRPSELAEVRVPVRDRTGVLAEVTTLATGLDINIADLELAHSSEGDAGVIIFLVEAGSADRIRDALLARGYRPSVQHLE